MKPTELKERGDPVELELTDEQAEIMDELGLKVTRVRARRGRWKVEASRLVGAVRVQGLELRITPKLEVKRLLFLLGFARNPINWHEEEIQAEGFDGLVPVMATVFARAAERALAAGPLHGYQRIEGARPTVRGRWRVGDQITRRYGVAPPIEVSYNAYTADVPENRLLLAATRRLLNVPDVPDKTRATLRGLRRRLAASVPGASPRRESARWSRTRANARFHTALDMAELILAERSYEPAEGRLRPDGFLINMEHLFEDFIFAALEQELRPLYGGRFFANQLGRHHLDQDRRAPIKLDLGWYMPGPTGERVIALADAKYMEKWHNSELYQQTAYCTALGVRRAHLIYAAGGRARTVYRVANSPIEIVRHTLDLTREIPELRERIKEIAQELHEDAEAARSRDAEMPGNPGPVAASSDVR